MARDFWIKWPVFAKHPRVLTYALSDTVILRFFYRKFSGKVIQRPSSRFCIYVSSVCVWQRYSFRKLWRHPSPQTASSFNLQRITLLDYLQCTCVALLSRTWKLSELHKAWSVIIRIHTDRCTVLICRLWQTCKS